MRSGMTNEGWRADTSELFAREGSRARGIAATLALSIATVTAVIYALPLSQPIDDATSNIAWTSLATIVLVVSTACAQKSKGMAGLRGSWLR
ncbi:MAG: hypothetical protein ACI9C1_002131 [Candidatus Aldehydirespiratoraceae bacterium]|jgi:hypothetical protein